MSDKRPNKVAEAIKNGTGTIITRVTIWVLPFIFTGAIYTGKVIVGQFEDKIFDRFDVLDHRLDRIVDVVKVNRSDISDLKASDAAQSARIDDLKEVVIVGRRR